MECLLLLFDATLSTLLTQPQTIISGLLLTFSVMSSVCQLPDHRLNVWEDGWRDEWRGGSLTELPSEGATPSCLTCVHCFWICQYLIEGDYIRHNIWLKWHNVFKIIDLSSAAIWIAAIFQWEYFLISREYCYINRTYFIRLIHHTKHW